MKFDQKRKITNKNNESKKIKFCYQTKMYLLKESRTFKIKHKNLNWNKI